MKTCITLSSKGCAFDTQFLIVNCYLELVYLVDWLFCNPAKSPENYLVDFSSLSQLFDSGNPGFFACLSTSG